MGNKLHRPIQEHAARAIARAGELVARRKAAQVAIENLQPMLVDAIGVLANAEIEATATRGRIEITQLGPHRLDEPASISYEMLPNGDIRQEIAIGPDGPARLVIKSKSVDLEAAAAEALDRVLRTVAGGPDPRPAGPLLAY